MGSFFYQQWAIATIVEQLPEIDSVSIGISEMNQA